MNVPRFCKVPSVMALVNDPFVSGVAGKYLGGGSVLLGSRAW